MKNNYLILGIAFLVSSCTIHLQIDTDFAAQSDGNGSINEEVNTKASATNTPTVETEISPRGP